MDLVREFDDAPMIRTWRHYFMQNGVNLIKNAMQSTEQPDSIEEAVRVRVMLEDSFVRIDVTDTGVGIAKMNWTSIFQRGFTTKQSGHGFRLYSSANAAGR